MQTGVSLSKEAQELLNESLQPTTVAAEVETPATATVVVEENITHQEEQQPQQQEQTKQQAANKQPMTEEQLEFVADIIVTTFDTVQEWGFVFLSNRKLRSKAKDIAGAGAMQHLNSLLRQQEVAARNKSNETLQYDTDEVALLELYDNVKKFQEDLPFDQRAAENIKFSLKQMLREKQQQLSPQMLLMISLLGALTPNAAALKTL